MADPLHDNEFRKFDTRTANPAGTGLDENGGRSAARQAPLGEPILHGAPGPKRELPTNVLSPDRQLPEGEAPRLSRTAEQVGCALGRVVSQAKRVPDTARRGLHLVWDRAQQVGGGAAGQISSSAFSIAGNAQYRVRELAETAEQRARQIADMAQHRGREFLDIAEARGRVLLDKADEIGQHLAERGSELKQQIEERTRELRAQTRVRAEEIHLRGERLVEERPLECLACVAGAALLLGVSLRIVRSGNARRY